MTNFLVKAYTYLALIAGILASIICIAFFGWMIGIGVSIVGEWISNFRKKAKVTAQSAGLA